MGFLRGPADVGTSGESQIRETLREAHHYAGGGPTPTLPLGLKAGVPASAGAVNLARVLSGFDPSTAEQVIEPSKLLLPPGQRPTTRTRTFTRLGPDYPELVHRNVKAGLQRLVGPWRLARNRRRRVVAGAFAVGKDETEDRAISAVLDANDSLDPRSSLGFALLSYRRCELCLRRGRLTSCSSQSGTPGTIFISLPCLGGGTGGLVTFPSRCTASGAGQCRSAHSWDSGHRPDGPRG